MPTREFQTLPAPSGMMSDPRIASSDISESYARRLLGFMPARGGVCVGAAPATLIYTDGDTLTGFFLHYVNEQLTDAPGPNAWAPGNHSYRLVFLTNTSVVSHRVYLEQSIVGGVLYLAPVLDADSALYSPFPMTLNTTVNPIGPGVVQSVQIGDETFITDGTNMRRFVTATHTADGINFTELERLYPFGMTPPADFAGSPTLGDDAPYVNVSAIAADPLQWRAYGQVDSGGFHSGDTDGAWQDWSTGTNPTIIPPTDLTVSWDISEMNAADDTMYFGFPQPFAGLVFVLKNNSENSSSTAATNLIGEYWNGVKWTRLIDFADGTYGNVGSAHGYYTTMNANGVVTWAPQLDWVSNTVDSVNTYWVRFRVSQPLYGTTKIAWVYPQGGWGITAGTYGLKLTDVDEHGRESSPNSAYDIAVGTPNDGAFYQMTVCRNSWTWSGSAWISTGYYNAPYALPTGTGDGQRTGWNLYRTVNGGAEFYLVPTALSTQTVTHTAAEGLTNGGQIIDSTTDTDLVAGALCPDPGYNDPPGYNGTSQIAAPVIGEFGGRVAVVRADRPNVLQISDAGSPTQFAALSDPTDPASGVDLLVGQADDAMIALPNYGGELAILKRNSIYRVAGQDATQYVAQFVSPFGCAGRDTVITMRDGVYFLATDGQVCRMAFGGSYEVAPVSVPIADVFRSTVTDAYTVPITAYASTARAWGMEDCYYLAIGGRTFVYDTLAPGWSELSYGDVAQVATLQIDMGQTRTDLTGPSEAVPFYGQPGHLGPQMTLFIPGGSGYLFALCQKSPVLAPVTPLTGTAVKVYDFASDAEGFKDLNNSPPGAWSGGAMVYHNSVDGDGNVTYSGDYTGPPASTPFTWEEFGVPAGKTVVSVAASLNYKQTGSNPPNLIALAVYVRAPHTSVPYLVPLSSILFNPTSSYQTVHGAAAPCSGIFADPSQNLSMLFYCYYDLGLFPAASWTSYMTNLVLSIVYSEGTVQGYTIPSPGQIAYRPFDGKGPAVNSMKRPERFVLRGDVPAGGMNATVQATSDCGGNETYVVPLGGVGAGLLLEQGFVDMNGTEQNITVSFDDTGSLAVRQATLEYTRLS